MNQKNNHELRKDTTTEIHKTKYLEDMEMSDPSHKMEDASFVLARHAKSLRYEDIPRDVMTVTKMSILDTLGVTAAASSLTPGVRELVSLIKSVGGKEESSVLGFGGRLPSWMAAFLNGAMAHCIDYDDMYDAGFLHPSSSTIPASIAIAERLGNVNGKTFLTAVCLGNDLVCRMGLSINYKFDWQITPLFGIFGAALSCGKLLGFDEIKFVYALGIALTQAATTMEVAYSPGSDLRGMYASFSAKGGVLSALMSDIGIVGPIQSLEGQAGLFRTYFNGEYDRKLLLQDLGKRFKHLDTTFKPWPSCRMTHPYIEGALSLVNQHDIQPRDIEEAFVYLTRLSEKSFFPLDQRRRPASILDAKFSIPFSVAIALVKRGVHIRDFTPEAIQDPHVLEVAQKVNGRSEPGLDMKGTIPGQIDLKTKSGQVFSKRVEFPRGHPRNPITIEELITKFRECVAFSAKPVSKSNVEEVIDMVMNMEKVNDIRQIINLLC